MSNLFKKTLKHMVLNMKDEKPPLYYELTKKTILTEKERGKYGVLGTSKL